MKLIVGLGNPGDKYRDTRHNTGFMVVDRMAGETKWAKSKSGLLRYKWLEVDGEKIELVKPETYMNKSGDAVGYLMKKHDEVSLEDLVVVHDDLDLALGEYKIQKGKGPKVHNGLNSVERVVGVDFWRVRVGVDNRTEEEINVPGEKYVLSNFTEEEKREVGMVIDKIVTKMKEGGDGFV